MDGQERREEISRLLKDGQKAISGSHLAKMLDVSRQVIVQDIALLRANGLDIISTSKGYILQKKSNTYSRVFKVHHSEENVQDEMFLIVDLGGTIEDVFIYHKVYDIVRAKLNISSRQEVIEYLDRIRSGKSSLLMNATSGYHYHTVSAKSELLLDMIQEKLQEKGFLARLQDYEPVDFWKKTNN